MNKTTSFILGLFFIGISSCSSEEEISLDSNSYLIFGHFYGECSGEGWVQYFKLTDIQLFKDTNKNNYTGKGFNFLPIEYKKYLEVKDLIDFFPEKLLESNKAKFGCPDCYDQGGLFIQYSRAGKIRTWHIDQAKEDVPEYLYEFMDKVNEKINLINN